jgi:hypothetical protein
MKIGMVSILKEVGPSGRIPRQMRPDLVARANADWNGVARCPLRQKL